MTDRPVRLILDTSAVLAYAAGNINVGEPVAEVAADGVRFTAAITCLAQAAQRVDEGWLNMLVRHEAFAATDLTFGQWRQLAALLGVVAEMGTASALLLALEYNCDILTADPSLYAALGDDPPIIAI